MNTKRIMTKIFSTTVFASILLFSQTANAQITLEHTFDGNIEYQGGQFLPVINLYLPYYEAVNPIRLYNEDYSLYKSITITPPANYSVSNLYLFSKNIVTTDNKVTFFVNFINPNATNSNQSYILRLYDEDGTMVKDFGYAATGLSFSFHLVTNNKYRLKILRLTSTTPYTYKTEIYSLPGIYVPEEPPVIPPGTTTSFASSRMETGLFSYPNPANEIITLPYQLKQGEISVMRIYNTNGQLIDTKQIDYVFDKILLNVSGYSKGVYLYEVNGKSNRFIVE